MSMRFLWLVALTCVTLFFVAPASQSFATIPYAGAGGALPGFGPGLIPPPLVGGKEYSHDSDSTTIGAVGSPPPFDAEQIIAWDGIGGTVDVTDYTGTRTIYTPDDEIDAIANHGDFAYEELKADVAHLVFSVDDVFTGYSFGAPFPGLIPAAGPVALPIGPIGGAGEISYELGTAFGAAPSTVGVWATQPMINGMPLPDDIDGTELWGPEPPLADADKYSLDVDGFSLGVLPGDAVSVWNGAPAGAPPAFGTPYIAQSLVIATVTALLGPAPPGLDPEINLDALMVHDVVEDPNSFDGLGGPLGAPGDEIIFSIRQIPDPGDPDGYYATGSELFVLNASAPPAFLVHGGHVWDHAYSLFAFEIFFADPNNHGVLDINAIEAIGEFAIPEPVSAVLLVFGCAIAGSVRRRI